MNNKYLDNNKIKFWAFQEPIIDAIFQAYEMFKKILKDLRRTFNIFYPESCKPCTD